MDLIELLWNSTSIVLVVVVITLIMLCMSAVKSWWYHRKVQRYQDVKRMERENPPVCLYQTLPIVEANMIENGNGIIDMDRLMSQLGLSYGHPYPLDDTYTLDRVKVSPIHIFKETGLYYSVVLEYKRSGK